jgi:hypothetical protein
MARHIAKTESDLPRVRLYHVDVQTSRYGSEDGVPKATVRTFEVIATSQGLCRVSDDGVRVDKPLSFDFTAASEKGYFRSFDEAKRSEVADVTRRISREADGLAFMKKALQVVRDLKAPKCKPAAPTPGKA